MCPASKILATVASLIAMAGLAVIGLVPYTRWTYGRDRRDLERALAPLARVSLEERQLDRDLALSLILPTDAQWRRLINRLGQPAFVLVLATDSAAIHPQAYSATRLQVDGTRSGRRLEISATNELPFGYSSTASQTAYKFSASANDVVQLVVRMTPAAVPRGALVMVFPLWNHLELWHWGDSLSMGQGLFQLVAPVLMVLGVVLIFVAVNVGLISLKPGR
jgi:hypothetical protein